MITLVLAVFVFGLMFMLALTARSEYIQAGFGRTSHAVIRESGRMPAHLMYSLLLPYVGSNLG